MRGAGPLPTAQPSSPGMPCPNAGGTAIVSITGTIAVVVFFWEQVETLIFLRFKRKSKYCWRSNGLFGGRLRGVLRRGLVAECSALGRRLLRLELHRLDCVRHLQESLCDDATSPGTRTSRLLHWLDSRDGCVWVSGCVGCVGVGGCAHQPLLDCCSYHGIGCTVLRFSCRENLFPFFPFFSTWLSLSEVLAALSGKVLIWE